MSAARRKCNIWCAKRVKSVMRREDVKRRAVIRVSSARRLEIDSGRSGAGSGLRAAAYDERRAF